MFTLTLWPLAQPSPSPTFTLTPTLAHAIALTSKPHPVIALYASSELAPLEIAPSELASEIDHRGRGSLQARSSPGLLRTERAEKTSPALAAVITVHSTTQERFLANQPEGLHAHKLPVTSFGETSFFKQLAADDVNERGGDEVDAAKVARMQRITLERLCRVYPAGLRVSSSNYPPLRAWRSGAQCVALNLQTNDLPTQLHHALFEGSQGYVLKPLGMRISEPDWPPASLTLTRVTLEILSLHGLPRPTESRPCLEGRHARCHQYAPQLSGD